MSKYGEREFTLVVYNTDIPCVLPHPKMFLTERDAVLEATRIAHTLQYPWTIGVNKRGVLGELRQIRGGRVV